MFIAAQLVASFATILVVVVLFRAMFIFTPLHPPRACTDNNTHHRINLTEPMLNRFMTALNIPTISTGIGQYDAEQMSHMIDHILASFPRLHSAPFVRRELVSRYTILYTVDGSDSTLRPYLLTSHMDVVPVVREKWSSDPFRAELKEDKHIYARGTMDAKHLLFAMLEALEHMLERGFKPRRGFYLVFGHDEEVSGLEGAQSIAKLLGERLTDPVKGRSKLEYVLDEGNIISKTRFPGVDANVGLVGVGEKGYLTVKLSTVGAVGHGSMPPPQTAIAKISGAVAKFHSHLLPSFMGRGVERNILEIFGSYARWPYRIAYTNFWLFKPVFEYVFSSDPTLNSLIRTSTAVTMISGGTKENVLPDSASAYINHRIHQLQTKEQILEFDRRVVNDPTINVEISGHSTNPTPTAPYTDNDLGWRLIRQSVLEVYPNTIVVPSIFLAASDSRWYTNLSDAIYKFSAIAVELEEMKRFHGHDERISVENYENLINFYHHLIENSDSAHLVTPTKAERSEL